jgi:hypothetical protein
MAALTNDRTAEILALGNTVPKNYQADAAVQATFYHKEIVIQDSAGKIIKYVPGPGLKVAGWNNGFKGLYPAGTRMDIGIGIVEMKNSATDPVTAGDRLSVVYLEDNQTIAKTSAGNTLSKGGILYLVGDDGKCYVQVGLALP